MASQLIKGHRLYNERSRMLRMDRSVNHRRGLTSRAEHMNELNSIYIAKLNLQQGLALTGNGRVWSDFSAS